MRLLASTARHILSAFQFSLNSVLFCFRFPLPQIFADASERFSQWPYIAFLLDLDPGTRQFIHFRARFRRAVCTSAYHYMLELRHANRIGLATLIVGLASYFAFLWILTQQSSIFLNAILAFCVAFAINGVAAVTAAAYSPAPWRRLGALAITFTVIAVVVGVISGTLSEFAYSTGETSLATSTAAGSIAVGGLDILGIGLARLAFWNIGRGTARFRSATVSHERLIVRSVRLLVRSSNEYVVLSDLKDFRDHVVLLESDLARSILLEPSGSDVVNSRRQGVLNAIRELQVWLALPQTSTIIDTHERLRVLTDSLLSGYLHNLPFSELTWISTSLVSENRLAARVKVLRAIAGAVLPAAIFVGWTKLGPGFPEPINQWAGGAVILWLVIRTVSLLDPDYTATLREFRSVLPGKTGSDSSK